MTRSPVQSRPVHGTGFELSPHGLEEEVPVGMAVGVVGIPSGVPGTGGVAGVVGVVGVAGVPLPAVGVHAARRHTGCQHTDIGLKWKWLHHAVCQFLPLNAVSLPSSAAITYIFRHT